MFVLFFVAFNILILLLNVAEQDWLQNVLECLSTYGIAILQYLHNLGFKTFSDFWSEDYDSINDPEERLLAVVDVIEFVCKHSIKELQDLCIKMESVLNYNFEYYVNEFKNNELKKFELACIENLKPRYV